MKITSHRTMSPSRNATESGFGLRTPLTVCSALFASLFLGACSGGGGTAAEGQGSNFSLLRVSNGFAELLPHKTFRIETIDQPGGSQIMSIRSMADLLDNVTVENPVQAVPVYPEEALLPNGEPGNHFIYAEFTSPLNLDSFLSSAPGLQDSNSMTGSVLVSSLDPITGESALIKGRVFLAGGTYGLIPTGSPSALPFEQWITASGDVVGFDTNGDTLPDSFPGLGFPGTESSFNGQDRLLSPNSLVFVVDTDNNLTTHETFPTGVQIRLEIKTAVLDVNGRPLANQVVSSTTVGIDEIAPEILSSPPPSSTPIVTPGGGEENVDPLTTIFAEFSESVQPWTVGDLLSQSTPGLSSAISVRFGPPTGVVDLPFSVMPVSPYDLSRWELIPIFNFPGTGPSVAECGVFNRVDVEIRTGNLEDLSANTNTLPGTTFFSTGEGPGVVNVPVTPDAVYLGRSGGAPGISVIDLNGFGGGTGNPTYDPLNQIVEGNTNYPNNPNLRIQGTALRPAIQAGSCTLDGGSAGVFTLSLDSSLNERVVRAPTLLSIGDMMLGWSLDVCFNNAPAPFGCQGSTGGNLCSADGLKQIATVIDGSTLSPAATNPQGTQILIDGGPNMVSWGPHPNPPPLVFPPLCVSPFIGGQEPTSIDTPVINLLIPGDPFGDPATGTPPNGLLSLQGNVFFQGPSLPAEAINNCTLYGLRQQLGHFMYVVDRARSEILVLNSNRMTVVDRIVVPDPTSLAIGTNLDLLAISSQSTDSVTFIDIDPGSSSFHQVVKTVAVGEAPRGIAWEPGNEDILVCNEGDNSVSIISAFSLNVRKVVSSNLSAPFEVAITPRMLGFGFQRNVYFAYIIGRNGKISVYESGPNSVNGWGFDDIIGSMPFEFRNPKTIQPDHSDLRSAFWVAHEGPLSLSDGTLNGSPTEGAITKVVAESAITGQLLLNFSSLAIPQFRDIEYAVQVSIGEERLTGVPVDLAFDNMTNVAGIVNWTTSFSAGSPIPLNGKSITRTAGGGAPTNNPRFLFAAVPSPTLGLGGVDVILLDGPFLRFDTNAFEPGVQSIDAIGTVTMMDYFRQ